MPKAVSTCALVFLAALGLLQAHASKHAAEQVSLCAVAQRPAAFLNQRVTLQAEMLADGMHGSALVDHRCTRGLIPDFADAEEAGKEYEKALFTGCPGTMGGKSIHASFTGVIRRERNTFVMTSAPYVYVLRITSMHNLKVTFEPGGSCHQPPSSDTSPHLETAPPNVFPNADIPH